MAGHLGLQEFTQMWYVILYSGDRGFDGASPVPSLQWHTQPTRQPQWPTSSSCCQSESLLTFSVVIAFDVSSQFLLVCDASVFGRIPTYIGRISAHGWGSNWQLIQSPFCTF